MCRLHEPNPPITVEVDEKGWPAAGAWQHREPVHEVVNRWRVDDDWRRLPISRTCYTVITPTLKLELYRDDIAGDRYLRRMIDCPRLYATWHTHAEDPPAILAYVSSDKGKGGEDDRDRNQDRLTTRDRHTHRADACGRARHTGNGS